MAYIPGQVQTQAAPPTGINAGGSFYPQATQTGYENQAGIAAPQYLSLLDQGGQLKAPFKFDPSQSDMFNQLKQTATSTDLSPWAQMQREALGQQTTDALDKSNTQSQGTTDQAMQQLMSTGGGMGGGAQLALAGMGARNATMAGQNIRNQQTAQDIAIRQGDATNKAQMLGQAANTEVGALGANVHTGIQDLTNQNAFSAQRYSDQMGAWGAAQTAEAQRQAARGGKK